MTDVRLSAGAFGVAYAAALATLLVLDGVWLGVVARDLYQREMGTLLADSVKLAPAAAFYLLYPLALVFLTMASPPSGWRGRGDRPRRGARPGRLRRLQPHQPQHPARLAAADQPDRLGRGGGLSAAAAAAAYAVTWARGGS